ncbi:MAG: aminotransferase, partial [Chitinophagaceae bacterium]
MNHRRKFLQQLALSAGAFSASSLFNKSFAADFQIAEKKLNGMPPEQAAADEDYWSVIQQAYTVNPNI